MRAACLEILATQILAEKDVAGQGTLNLEEVGTKPKRKHFFSPLDPALANAVRRDAEAVQFTEAEEVHSSYHPTWLLHNDRKPGAGLIKKFYFVWKLRIMFSINLY